MLTQQLSQQSHLADNACSAAQSALLIYLHLFAPLIPCHEHLISTSTLSIPQSPDHSQSDPKPWEELGYHRPYSPYLDTHPFRTSTSQYPRSALPCYQSLLISRPEYYCTLTNSSLSASWTLHVRLLIRSHTSISSRHSCTLFFRLVLVNPTGYSSPPTCPLLSLLSKTSIWISPSLTFPICIYTRLSRDRALSSFSFASIESSLSHQKPLSSTSSLSSSLSLLRLSFYSVKPPNV